MFFTRNKFRIQKRDIEPQEILLDKLSSKRDVEMGNFEVPVSNLIIKIILIIAIAMSIFLLSRTFSYQIINGQTFKEKSIRNQFIIKTINSGRGIIYDKNDKQLVYNTISFTLLCKKSKYSDNLLKQISDSLSLDYEELNNTRRNKDNDVIIIKDIPKDKLALVYGNIDLYIGCRVEKNIIREYLTGEHLSHLIGYEKEGEGMGVEFAYNEYLESSAGSIRKERDAVGKIISEDISELPKPGNNIHLNIDVNLQKKIKETLQKYLDDSQAKSASGIAIDPRNGKVLAMVSLPGFDNNIFSKGVSSLEWQKILDDPRTPFLNRTIGGLYPAASTIKPFIAMAALEHEIIKPSDVLYCPQQLCLPNPYSGVDECFVDWRAHSNSNMYQAIAQSVNPYFYKIAGGYKDFKGLGIVRLSEYLSQFPFGRRTGIDIAGEVQGVMPTPEYKKEKYGTNWSLGDTYNLAIGHGYVQVTPIQIAMSTAVIANRGTLYKPQIINYVTDQQGNVIKTFENKPIIKDFLKNRVLEPVRQGMRETVSSGMGTAHMLDNLPVMAACKTGTAQTPRSNYFDIWISIFAPYEEPEIVLVLLGEDVRSKNFFVLNSSYEVLKWYFKGDEIEVKKEIINATIE